MTQIGFVARNNLQGYYLHFFLQRLVATMEEPVTINPIFVPKGDLNCPEFLKAIREHEIVFAVGLPFWENERSSINEVPKQTLKNLRKVYHFATFGQVYEDNEQFVSLVDEVGSPVRNLTHIVPELQEILGLPAKGVDEFYNNHLRMIRLVDGYNRYELEEAKDGGLSTLNLLDLGMLYGEDLHRELLGLDSEQEIAKHTKTTLIALERNRTQYVRSTAQKAKTRVVKDVVIVFAYAELHTNEVAHLLIDLYRKFNYKQILVFMGTHTRGDDMFSIRSYGIHAGNIAKAINNGKGKENTATVFLGNPSVATFNALVISLSNIL